MQLREHGDKIDASLKSEIETAIVETRGAIESNDPDQMEAKSQALAQVAMRMGQAIYEKEQATNASGGADAGAAQGGEAGGRRKMWSTPNSRKWTTKPKGKPFATRRSS
jgi:molecular chaperone DnaK